CCPFIAAHLFTIYHYIQLDTHSFPTRRSSDLINPSLISRKYFNISSFFSIWLPAPCAWNIALPLSPCPVRNCNEFCSKSSPTEIDRKSTRLNSSHVKISYAVFCLKKNNFSLFI